MTEMIDPVTGEIIDQKQLAEQLLAQAKAQGMSLVGPGNDTLIWPHRDGAESGERRNT